MFLISLAHAGPIEVPAYELTMLESEPPGWPEGLEVNRNRSCSSTILFDAEGKVADVEVRRCPDPFENAAVEALSLWRIEPYLDEDRPVPVLLSVNVQFHRAEVAPRAAVAVAAGPEDVDMPPPESREWWRTGAVPPEDPVPTGEAHDWHLLVKSPQMPPKMPKQAADLGVQGTCIVLVHVDADGHPYGAQAQECPDAFVDSSLDAVQRWRLDPLEKDGVPERSSVLIRIAYE